MCHGLPRFHPCSHTSVIWNYCLSAIIDLQTGYETPCPKTSFAHLQPTASRCSLRNCAFSDLNGSWTCCQCGERPNVKGWCEGRIWREGTRGAGEEWVEVTCGHGCCRECRESFPSTDRPKPYSSRTTTTNTPRHRPSSSSSSFSSSFSSSSFSSPSSSSASKHESSKPHTASYGFPPVRESEYGRRERRRR